ncbi:MAG: succinate--CoA ligase subunit alpha [Candidatus Thermoplasmatota archaeon]|jgi:succinyl-CoA synthetase alpha subunit|nr:succinate--CoA ligase subunit alpha [Candidatus Thermoplasmatota archaeon]
MSVFVDASTRVLVLGITGHQGTIHTRGMKAFGTQVVAGTSMRKGVPEVEGVPVFESVEDAVKATHPNTACLFVPAPFAKDALFEVADAGIPLAVIITEHIPFHDMLDMLYYASAKGTRILGPNCPGIATPGAAKVGILPNVIFKPGNVGVVSRSGTLTYEIVNNLTENGFGETTCIGLGGDPVPGTTFIDALAGFQKDPETHAIVMVGEIGGVAEEEAAEYIGKHVTKPVVSYVAGQSAPPGKRMGHAGAIITRGKGTAESKVQALSKAGVRVAKFPYEIPGLVRQALKA